MIRILMDYRAATVKPGSGVSRQMYAFENYLRSRDDIELLYVTDGPNEHPQRDYMHMPAQGVPLEKVPRPGRRLWFEQSFLPKLIKKLKPDIFYGTINSGLPLRSCGNTLFVQWTHDLFHISEKSAFPSLKGKLRYLPYYWFSFYTSMRRAHFVHAISDFTRNECERLFPFTIGKTAVIANCVPRVDDGANSVIEYAEVEGLPDDYWLLVGSNEPRKNLPRFIAQWLALSPSERKPLVLVGEPSALLVPLTKVADFYFYHGVSDAQLNTIYRNAACLWQPSLAEGFGLPVIEALVHGTPVAVARGSALDEVAPPEMPRFDGLDDKDIQRCMRQLAVHPLARPDREMLRRYLDRYDRPAFEQRLGAFIDRVISERGQ